MTRAPLSPSGPARRTVVAAAGAAGLAAALSACSDTGTDADAGSGSGGTPDATGPASSPASGATARPLAATADIPEGGGVVFAQQKVVVTQPSAGEFTRRNLSAGGACGVRGADPVACAAEGRHAKGRWGVVGTRTGPAARLRARGM